MQACAFTDGNGVTVRPPDEVQYRFGARHGELVEVFSDGDAYVRFFDNTKHLELVKWKHLCGVPEACRVGGSEMSKSPVRLAFDAALAAATAEARAVLKPGDRISRELCGGLRGTFVFTGWDGDTLRGRTVDDCHAVSVLKVNGVPVRFGDRAAIEAANAAWVAELSAERATRMRMMDRGPASCGKSAIADALAAPDDLPF